VQCGVVLVVGWSLYCEVWCSDVSSELWGRACIVRFGAVWCGMSCGVEPVLLGLVQCGVV